MAEKKLIMTPYFRMSHPHLAEMRAKSEKKPDIKTYQVNALFPKKDSVGKLRADGKPFSPWGDFAKHDLQEIEAERLRLIAGPLTAAVPNIKANRCFTIVTDGDSDAKGDNVGGAPEMFGHWFMRLHSFDEIQCIDQNRELIKNAADIKRIFAPGSWARAVVDMYVPLKSAKENPGVSIGFTLIQFVRADERIVGKGGSRKVDLAGIAEIPDADLAGDTDDLI